jgi:hypothetical protein
MMQEGIGNRCLILYPTAAQRDVISLATSISNTLPLAKGKLFAAIAPAESNVAVRKLDRITASVVF